MKFSFVPKSFRLKRRLLYRFISSLDENKLNLLILLLHNDDYFYRYFPFLSELDISSLLVRNYGTGD